MAASYFCGIGLTSQMGRSGQRSFAGQTHGCAEADCLGWHHFLE
jgi:hypothetical protein